MIKKRGLGGGRGLSALLGQASESAEELRAIDQGHFSGHELRQMPVHQLQRGRYQPRRDMVEDALAELADSIRQHGVMQPLVVRAVADERYEIIAGERRWRAAQLAGLEQVPVIVRSIDDETASVLSLIENIQREDLHPMEQAQALQRLAEEFGLTHERLAQTVGKSRATVSNMLRLLQLQGEVRQMLEHGDLEMGHARALLSLPALQQQEAAHLVVARALSVRQTEELVRRMQNPKPKKTVTEDPDVRRLCQDLSEKIGAPVQIHNKEGGRGTLSITYYSLAELEGILTHIR